MRLGVFGTGKAHRAWPRFASTSSRGGNTANGPVKAYPVGAHCKASARPDHLLLLRHVLSQFLSPQTRGVWNQGTLPLSGIVLALPHHPYSQRTAPLDQDVRDSRRTPRRTGVVSASLQQRLAGRETLLQDPCHHPRGSCRWCSGGGVTTINQLSKEPGAVQVSPNQLCYNIGNSESCMVDPITCGG